MMMKKVKAIVCGLILATAGVTSVYAGPYADRMGQCLVQKTTPQDRMALMQWFFSAMAAHPNLKGVANISDKQAQSYDQNVAKLLMRLLTQDCRAEVKEAVSREGNTAMQGSFQVLGQVAAVDLMQSPDVQKRMMGFTQYLDEKKLEDVMK
ncbi:hypothetical protein CUZ56_03023 [Saezia sanguinis]|jgi:hypothetical protein|uniref:Uncharacterized protein n=2 Tax=Saezia sanguinis TaxID=1965230 RepID=A0A433S9N7_9BURK|nr:hypothetical protein CUZ56_03023 [Saezia sanguinis]